MIIVYIYIYMIVRYHCYLWSFTMLRCLSRETIFCCFQRDWLRECYARDYGKVIVTSSRRNKTKNTEITEGGEWRNYLLIAVFLSSRVSILNFHSRPAHILRLGNFSVGKLVVEKNQNTFKSVNFVSSSFPSRPVLVGPIDNLDNNSLHLQN